MVVAGKASDAACMPLRAAVGHADVACRAGAGAYFASDTHFLME